MRMALAIDSRIFTSRGRRPRPRCRLGVAASSTAGGAARRRSARPPPARPATSGAASSVERAVLEVRAGRRERDRLQQLLLVGGERLHEPEARADREDRDLRARVDAPLDEVAGGLLGEAAVLEAHAVEDERDEVERRPLALGRRRPGRGRLDRSGGAATAPAPAARACPPTRRGGTTGSRSAGRSRRPGAPRPSGRAPAGPSCPARSRRGARRRSRSRNSGVACGAAGGGGSGAPERERRERTRVTNAANRRIGTLLRRDASESAPPAAVPQEPFGGRGLSNLAEVPARGSGLTRGCGKAVPR